MRAMWAVVVLGGVAAAQVAELRVASREVVAGGRSFGAGGRYEIVRGTVRLALDPSEPLNARIVDLRLAPTNPEGRVEATADLVVLQPVDPARRRGTALLEVCNRGGMASLGSFCRATSRDLSRPEAFGDGLLLRLGATVVWCGWQCDVPDEPGRLRLRAPIAVQPDGSPIEGLVRTDHVAFEPVARIELGHRGHVPYPVVRPDSDEHVLTRRRGRDEEREIVPRERWRFSADGRAAERRDGRPFDAGFVYELVWVARDPNVVGLGLAAIRDVASWLRYGPDCPFSVQHVVAVGISQTGRFLRHFIWQGFTTDTAGRQALDGVLALTAGAGRGSFDHRFAQPSRDAHRFSAFAFPTDLFPFTSRLQEDPVTGRIDGLFARQHDPAHLPRVFWVNTGYEYFGRAAALIHTTVDGRRDLAPTARERIYHLASAQHYPGTLGRDDPVDTRAAYRALLIALLQWVEDGVEPPPSAYPRLADGTLVPLAARSDLGIPGVRVPAAIQTAHRADYGPDFPSRGIVAITPPRLGPAFASLVPATDALGNELGGVRCLELRVPVATYLPYRVLGDDTPFPGELQDFVGSFVPLPLVARDGDPRPSLAALYGDREHYLDRCRAALADLVAERVVLGDDVGVLLEHAGALWDAAVR
ncbi:MAG: hypothetical protein IPM29_23360 [Planctomycetes bacterium]|nr:hypothetical protein [Planctomycetota bacterium]